MSNTIYIFNFTEPGPRQMVITAKTDAVGYLTAQVLEACSGKRFHLTISRSAA